MEPHAIVAEWDGDRLTLDTPNQALGDGAGPASRRTSAFRPRTCIIRSPFLGGGFGSKAILAGPQILAILAARMLRRPVKLVLTRDQMYGPVGHRGATRQQLALGTDAEGRLTALQHHAQADDQQLRRFHRTGGQRLAQSLRQPGNLDRGTRAVRLDIGTPGPMRAPGEASGSAALECAMDEAAVACGIDPLEFRLRNYAETDPADRQAVFGQGAARMLRRGRQALRLGRAAAASRGRCATRPATSSAGAWARRCFHAPMFQAEARATLRADGTALVETAGADMGQGAWTALAQIAADGLGLDIDRIEFRVGLSELPDGGVAGGSGHTATAGSALHNAGTDVDRQARRACHQCDPDSPLFGAGNAGVEARGGRLYHRGDESRSESYADILARAGVASLEGQGRGARDPANAEARAMFSHGAVFAEVKVDPDLGQVRVTRLVGAFAAGRIINPQLARSQLYGGMIWGVSFALHEEAIHDRRTGRPMNADLAGYHVPVNADIPDTRGAADRRGRSLRQRAGRQGRRRDRHHRHRRRDRQCDLACDRGQGASLPDPHRGHHYLSRAGVILSVLACCEGGKIGLAKLQGFDCEPTAARRLEPCTAGAVVGRQGRLGQGA